MRRIDPGAAVVSGILLVVALWMATCSAVHAEGQGYTMSTAGLLSSTLPDDNTYVGNSSNVATATAIPDCDGTGMGPLYYDTTLNVFRCKGAAFFDVTAYGADGSDLVDDTAAIALAIAAIPTGSGNVGGTLFFPKGTYHYTSLSLNNITGLQIVGEGREYGTILKCTSTGATTCISAHGTSRMEMSHIRFEFVTTHTGNGFEGDSGTSLAAGLWDIHDVTFAGTQAAGQTNHLLHLEQSLTVSVRDSLFSGGGVGIYGTDGVFPNFSNAIQIRSNYFEEQAVVSIQNPYGGWLIEGNTFEPLVSGNAGAVGHTSGVCSYALQLSGNWTGDVQSSGTGTWFTLCGDGISITGNLITSANDGGTGGVDGIVFDENDVEGVSITGNFFSWLRRGISFGSTTGHAGVHITGNFFETDVIAPLHGTRPEYSLRCTGTTCEWRGEKVLFTSSAYTPLTPPNQLGVVGGLFEVGPSSSLSTTPSLANTHGLLLGCTNGAGECRAQAYSSTGSNFLTVHTNASGAASTEKLRVTSDANSATGDGVRLGDGVPLTTSNGQDLAINAPENAFINIDSEGVDSADQFRIGHNTTTLPADANTGVRVREVASPGMVVDLMTGTDLNFYNAANDQVGTLKSLEPLTATRTWTLPDETGTVCTTGSVCTGYQAGPLSGDVVTSGAVATIQANSVALTTDTTGNYAAGDAEAGNALTGDSATAFFSSGELERTLLPAASADCPANQYTKGVDADFVLDCAQPDHGNLAGNGDDDHTQYLLLAGRSGGQTAIGGTASGNDLTLRGNSAASDGDIIMSDRTELWDDFPNMTAGTQAAAVWDPAFTFTSGTPIAQGISLAPTITDTSTLSQLRFIELGGTISGSPTFGGVFNGVLAGTTIKSTNTALWGGRLFTDSFVYENDTATNQTSSEHTSLFVEPTFKATSTGNITQTSYTGLRVGGILTSAGANTATITTANGVRIENIAQSGAGTETIGTYYGIRIADLSASGSVFPIYSAGDDPSKIAGKLSIGTDQTPSATLHVEERTVGNEVLRLESTATNDDVTEQTFQYRGTTTDGTITTLGSITVTSGTVMTLEARVVARCTGGATCGTATGAGYTVTMTCINTGAGATAVGTVDQDVVQESTAGWDATIDCDSGSNTARVRVTGAATSNITWHATVRSMAVGS